MVKYDIIFFILKYDILLDHQKRTYLEMDTHQIASKNFCSKIIFEIKAAKDTETLTYVVKIFYYKAFTGIEKHDKNLALKV